MKKNYTLFLLILLLFSACAFAQSQKIKHFDAKGEIMSVDPLYGRITIKHGPIKDFAGDAVTEFTVSAADILKGLATKDLVDFSVNDEKGDAQIEKITKTGVAAPAPGGIPIGAAARDVLLATGKTAEFVTSPIPPAQGLVQNTVGTITEGTGNAVEDVNVPEVKSKF